MRKEKSVNHMPTREMEIIRSARQKKELSQMKVANLAYMDVREYQRLEYGERSPSAVSMRKGLAICAVLEIDPYELVHWILEE